MMHAVPLHNHECKRKSDCCITNRLRSDAQKTRASQLKRYILNMISLGYIGFTLLLLTIPAIGIFLIYSALTGKGIEEPEKDSLFNLHAQYRIRGLTGVGFIIAGFLILWEFYSVL